TCRVRLYSWLPSAMVLMVTADMPSWASASGEQRIRRDNRPTSSPPCGREPLAFFMLAHQFAKLLGKCLGLALVQRLLQAIEKVDLLRRHPEQQLLLAHLDHQQLLLVAHRQAGDDAHLAAA